MFMEIIRAVVTVLMATLVFDTSGLLFLDENLSRRIVPELLNQYPESTQVALEGLFRRHVHVSAVYLPRWLLRRHQQQKT